MNRAPQALVDLTERTSVHFTLENEHERPPSHRARFKSPLLHFCTSVWAVRIAISRLFSASVSGSGGGLDTVCFS